MAIDSRTSEGNTTTMVLTPPDPRRPCESNGPGPSSMFVPTDVCVASSGGGLLVGSPLTGGRLAVSRAPPTGLRVYCRRSTAAAAAAELVAVGATASFGLWRVAGVQPSWSRMVAWPCARGCRWNSDGWRFTSLLAVPQLRRSAARRPDGTAADPVCFAPQYQRYFSLEYVYYWYFWGNPQCF